MSPFPEQSLSAWMICEAIVLDDVRELTYVIDLTFWPEKFVLDGQILITTEVADGYDEFEILTLPRRRTETFAEFLATLDEYVERLCAEPGVLDRCVEHGSSAGPEPQG